MPCPLMVLDGEGRIRAMNEAIAQMFGLSTEAAEARHALAALVDSVPLHDCIAATHKQTRTQRVLIAVGGGARVRHLQCTVAPTQLEGQPMLLLMAEDLTAHKLIEDDLLHLSSHDALTGLPNRSLLGVRLAQAAATAERSATLVAVMYIDLDRFKNINDSLGHEAGDELIVEISKRLSSAVRDIDTVARHGGDEFVVVLPDLNRGEKAAIVARKLLRAIQAPMDLLGQEVSIAGSIGISLYPKDGTDAETLLMNADTATYKAKDAGGNTFQFYAQAMNALTLEHLRIEAGLRRALEREQFVLYYQPQVDAHSGAMIGVEALLRWEPQGEAAVGPAQFIPIAEECGLIVPIGEWVLRTACAQQRAWVDKGHAPLKMAVNLSARQFQQANLVELVAQILEETGCEPAWLELELTESMMMRHPEAAIATQQALADMGMQLAIDDFGTGYSSLNYLKRFPIDCLKIDQSFVRDVTTDPHGASIAKAVIALGHSMQLTVLAEGVETIEQLDFLREHGCDQIQGYYASRPVPAKEIEVWLKTGPVDMFGLGQKMKKPLIS
jgi:diguanylate cyclase (GGDEF)-like protein/PAS domain S-box-containing protein